MVVCISSFLFSNLTDIADWLFVSVQLISGVGFLVVGFRGASYVSRFRKSGGRQCFNCGYPLGYRPDRCSECGHEWDPSRLKILWKKMIHPVIDDSAEE